MSHHRRLLLGTGLTLLPALLLVACGEQSSSAVDGPTLSSQAVTCGVWNATTTYLQGDTVTYNGGSYRANWWTQGDNPGIHSGPAGSGQPWTTISGCGTVTPPTNPSPTSSGTVCFYTDINYGGQSFCADGSSAYVGDAWNDKISSVKVKNGYSVQLFADINYAGASKTFSADTASVGADFNDLASSFKITTSSTPPPPPTPSGKYVGTYYATFARTVPRLKDIDPNYNLIFLFSATNAGGAPAGTLKFNPPPDGNGAWTNWVSDLQYTRSVQKRTVLLSVGGAGNALRFTDRTVSTTFVNSIDKLYTDWKGFDGIDFNTFEGDAAPNTPEMIWAAQELKRRHPGFIIAAPPAPWNKVDQQFCKDMLSAGALDFCAPQYYDGPQLSDPTYLLSNVKIWMDLLGPDHVVVGFGVNNELNNYWKIDSAVSTFKQLKAQYPAVKGVFDWRLDWDVAQGYPFARQFAPLVK